MESDICKLDLSPNTVLPPLRKCSNIENRCGKVKPLRKDEILKVKEGFTDISFRRYRSASCKSSLSRPMGMEGSPDSKRSSVYQSTNEVRKREKKCPVDGKSKLEMSRSSDASFSFRIIDSLCSSDEGVLRERRVDANVSSEEQDSFIEVCLNSDIRERGSAETLGSDGKDVGFECEPVFAPLDDGNDLLEQDRVLALPKSRSAKVEVPHSPSLSESEWFSRGSSRTRFSPMKKMFDPFIKSKSLRSPLGIGADAGDVSVMRNRRFRKSLLHDFSQNSEPNPKDHPNSAAARSPVHLHGRLRLVNKQGMPFFEFSVNQPEDVYVAKPWKTENARRWVYTFHSIGSRKNSNVSVWGSNDTSKDSSSSSPIVGQMNVSCYLCSEVKDCEVSNDSMVTEFVAYDIARGRDVVVRRSSDVCDDGSDAVKQKDRSSLSSDNEKLDSLHESNPWGSADLRPDLEIAAIVLQVPVEKRESLKYKRGDHKSGDKRQLNLLNLSIIEENKKDSQNQEQVKVVIPAGNHGLPCVESRGPSCLLDRWRLGGSCDCGGWDMACPLAILGNPSIKCCPDRPVMDSQRPFELYVQGTKEDTPALTMTAIEEGEYAVHFHAQLSTLQAFCVCVAILHGSDASSAAKEQQSVQLTQCSSLKMLIEEEFKFLIDSVAGEEENKKKVVKKEKDIPPSYVVNPPFSPIARV